MTDNYATAGAVYDVGGALALYWPDVHPCGASRDEPWLILYPEGGTRWTRRLLNQARYLGTLPGMAQGLDTNHVDIVAREITNRGYGADTEPSDWWTNTDEETRRDIRDEVLTAMETLIRLGWTPPTKQHEEETVDTNGVRRG